MRGFCTFGAIHYLIHTDFTILISISSTQGIHLIDCIVSLMNAKEWSSDDLNSVLFKWIDIFVNIIDLRKQETPQVIGSLTDVPSTCVYKETLHKKVNMIV